MNAQVTSVGTRLVDPERLRRGRRICFMAAGFGFLANQLALTSLITTGATSASNAAWLFVILSMFAVVLPLLALADSHARVPAWPWSTAAPEAVAVPAAAQH